MEQKVSVIVPVYRAEKTLRRCVESLVLGQERGIEVILVEDCSPDNSWAACCELAQEFSNVRCIRNEQNSGVSFTRNAGLAAARGEYILFVDSDDWVSERYVRELLTLGKKNPDALAICGHHFLDKVGTASRDYLWDNSPGGEFTLKQEDFFRLSDRFLIQQLWNKIFRRDVIEAHQLRFDESMRMGEDFQFVLDYMTAIQCKKCVVLNEPLYYYIRWNSASLMGSFGFIENQDEFSRIRKLACLAGPEYSDRAEQMIRGIRRNYVYHIARNLRRSREEKLAAIERVMGDGRAAEHYRAERRVYAKEQLAEALRRAKTLYPRLKARLDRKQQAKRIAEITSTVQAKDVTILSQNCIGGVFYHDMGMQFLSPTINLFMMEPDFVNFVLDLEHYLHCELRIQWGESYPIGELDDIRIHFMHYETCQEAKQAWERRVKRIRHDRIVVVATDRNGFHEDVYRLWKKIPYPKVLFTADPRYTQDPDSVFFPEYQAQGFVPDLIPRREFYKDGKLIQTINQLGGTHDTVGEN